MSSAFNPCDFFAVSIKLCSDSSVMVFSNSVSTTPGSIHVTLMFERALNSCLNPSLKADDIANAILFAVQSPEHMNVNEILVRPTTQER